LYTSYFGVLEGCICFLYEVVVGKVVGVEEVNDFAFGVFCSFVEGCGFCCGIILWISFMLRCCSMNFLMMFCVLSVDASSIAMTSSLSLG
jgi:hypothetical protein